MLNQLEGSSEDEFPDVDVIVRRYRNAVEGKQEKSHNGVDEAPTTVKSVPRAEKDANSRLVKSNTAVKATPLRRRKLGQGQTIDSSLLKSLGSTVISKERETRSSKPKTSRSRARLREEGTEVDASSKDASISPPAKARQAGSRTVSSNTIPSFSSKEKARPKKNDPSKDKDVKNRLISKKSTKKTIPSDESDEEPGLFKDTPRLSEDEFSEFVSASESESESGSDSNSAVSNSDFEAPSTPPIRRSRSPSVQWAKPQRVLFKDPVKKTSFSDKQHKGVNNDSTKLVSKQRKPGGATLDSFKTSQSGNLEDAFQKLQIFNEDSDLDEPSGKEDKRPVLEPTTPRKTLPASLLKTPRIPTSPWKPEHKEFWDSEAHFSWIDKHSPDKRLDSPEKMQPSTKDQTKMDGKLTGKRVAPSPEKQKRDERKAFEAAKEELAFNFLCELDERITAGRLAQLTKDTGGLRVTWSNSLLATAGRAHWKCKTLTTTRKALHPDSSSNAATTTAPSIKREETKQHQAYIELASKVITKETDLLNTVAHEFCHLAVFMLNGKVKQAHGREFRAWGHECQKVFGASKGIEVTTKHNYEIDYKYVWRCEMCLSEVKRHSKSVHTDKHRCGVCRGTLAQIKPKPRGAKGGTPEIPDGGADGENNDRTTRTTKKPTSAWNEFVGRELKVLSQTNPEMSHKDRMTATAAKWKQQRSQENGDNRDRKEEKKKEKTIRELRTAVEVLTIDEKEEKEGERGKEEKVTTAAQGGCDKA